MGSILSFLRAVPVTMINKPSGTTIGAAALIVAAILAVVAIAISL
jgi:hypothetical protein